MLSMYVQSGKFLWLQEEKCWCSCSAGELYWTIRGQHWSGINLLLLSLLSPLSRIFTVCATCNVILPMKYGLYFYISTFHSKYTVPSMAVFCISLISCFPGMLFSYCLSDFVMVPVTLIITGITFTFTFHMH